MFTLPVPADIRSYCEHLLTCHTFGRRGIADGTAQQQCTGLIGQCVIHALFERPFPDGEAGCDGGVDFHFAGKSIDVKTMGRTTDMRSYYVHNFIAFQKHFETQIYIFCSLNLRKDILTVCGWVTKQQLHERACFYQYGEKRFRSDGSFFHTKADLYEIRNTELNQADTFSDLWRQLAAF